METAGDQEEEHNVHHEKHRVKMLETIISLAIFRHFLPYIGGP